MTNLFRTLLPRKGAARGPREALLPWQVVRVVGPSMVPALRPGDRLVVRHGASVRAGDVVLARFADLPGRLVVKRALRPVDGGWWVASDNEAAGGDSRTHGPARVLARAVLLVRSGAVRPARVPAPVRP
ncbi:MAG: S24/S26 family peptidase [Jatrophihabitans sp.]|uniref:S24/S26 family peptidase n=1 Tax=Jatrophihabitans sp. TaxID=1932789 RepID=UPI003F7D8A35